MSLGLVNQLLLTGIRSGGNTTRSQSEKPDLASTLRIQGAGIARIMAVFEGMSNPSQKGVVVVNYQDDPAEATVGVAGAPEAKVLIPFQPKKTVQLPAKLQIPAKTCAVIVANNAQIVSEL